MRVCVCAFAHSLSRIVELIPILGFFSEFLCMEKLTSWWVRSIKEMIVLPTYLRQKAENKINFRLIDQ